MKRLFLFIDSEEGFILPIVLVTAIIIFTMITSHIYIYKNDMHITSNHQEQLKMETLFQMSLIYVQEDLPTIEHFPSYLTYEFPYGIVTVHVPEQHHNEYTFHIQTDHDSNFTMKHSI